MKLAKWPWPSLRGERDMPEGGNMQPHGRPEAFGEDTEEWLRGSWAFAPGDLLPKLAEGC